MITRTDVWPDLDSFNSDAPHVTFELDNAECSIKLCLDGGRELVFAADDFRYLVRLADIPYD